MPIRKLGCLSDSHYAAGDAPPLYRSQAVAKATQALSLFLAEGVEAIMVLGDLIEDPETAFAAPFRAQEIADLINGHGAVAHTLPVIWVPGNHDCDHVAPAAYFKTDWAAATGATITTNGSDHNDDTIRGYVDVASDLRLVYLDFNFNASGVSLPVQQTYGTVTAAQLTWLESTLAAADAAGRYSIVAIHLPLKHGGDIIANAAAVRSLIAGYRVIGTIHGHKHWESMDTLGANVDGETILEFVIPDLRNGNFTTENAGPCSILGVDTDDGRIVSYEGHYFPASYGAETISGHAWEYVPPAPNEWSTLIAAGSAWKYDASYVDRNTAYNAAMHPNWTDAAFNDAGWSSGAAPVGYGETWLGTAVTDPGSGNRDKCLYLRKTFTLEGASRVTDLKINVMRDDGVVVYLNGQEYGRLGMAAGVVNQRTLANVNVYTDPPEQTWFELTDITASDPTTLLIEGENVIAVELHNTNATSPDLALDVEVLYQQSAPVPSRPRFRQLSRSPRALFMFSRTMQITAY